MARDGEQAAAAWKSVKRRPLLASLSRLGVLISPPKQLKSLKPCIRMSGVVHNLGGERFTKSSATITRKLGRFPTVALEARDALMFVGDEHIIRP